MNDKTKCWKADPALFAAFQKAWLADCPGPMRFTFRPLNWSLGAVKNFMDNQKFVMNNQKRG